MKTEVIKIHSDFPEKEKIARCAKMIRQGGLVIFPTETVYGIAADAANPKAMQRLKEVKKRSDGKPFSVMIAQKDSVAQFSPMRDLRLFKLIDRFWPGPLTVIVPGMIEGETIGLRMPGHAAALCLVQACDAVIAAPSANIEGNPAPRTCEEALKDLDGLVDAALDAGSAEIGISSTIFDFTPEKPTLIRAGKITQEEIDNVMNKKTVLMVCTGNSCRSVMAEYLMRDKLKGRSDVEVLSAGTSVFLTASASMGALRVLKERGINAGKHRSQPLTSILLKKADLILVMTQQHREAVWRFEPDVASRTHLLKEFLVDNKSTQENLDINDPMGQADTAYEQCAEVIDAALDEVLKTL